MDSQHRHELEQNDLAAFLENFGPWWAKYGNKLLIVALAVVLVITGRRWINAQSAATLENAWNDLANSTSPDGYRLTAQSHSVPAVRVLAYLRAADLLLNQSATPQAPDTSTPTPPVTPPDQALSQAEEMYRLVANDADADLVFQLNARLGLAAVAEGRKQWDQAATIYQTVAQEAAERFPVIATRAQTRLTNLSRLKQSVVFAPEPPAPATPAEPAPTPPANP